MLGEGEGESIEPGASSSCLPASVNEANSSGSNFQGGNEGFGEASGAVVIQPANMVASLTDITLDQALVKMTEIDKENLFLKEALAENNKQIKRQFEMVTTLHQKDKVKVDQFKALITSLREEVREQQIKLMAQQDREKENENRLTTLENENLLLQRQKALSDQRATTIVKQAETQGVSGFSDMDSLPDMSEAVIVTTEDKEKELENLQASLAAKEDIIARLRNELLTMNDQKDQYKMSNDILLKDMQGLQNQKGQLDADRRDLYEKNRHLEKELNEQKQESLRREATNFTSPRKEKSQNQMAPFTGKELSLNLTSSFDDGENLEELFDKKLIIQQNQDEIERLTIELEAARTDREELKTDKEDMEEKLQHLSKEHKELQSQYELAQEKMDILEREKVKQSEVFEEQLASVTVQRQENKTEQARLYEDDQTALRSQVVSLLNEVEESNNRLSAANLAMQQKDRRISELSEANEGWKTRFNEQCYQSSMMVQALQRQVSQQESERHQDMAENAGTRQQHQELQDNFNRLVTDYKDLLEMFEAERAKSRHQGASKEMMEEMNKRAAEVIAAEEAINYRDKQIEDRDRQLGDFKGKLAEMEEKGKLLHIQLETYQSDFQMEREARAKIAQERNELDEELRTAREQNQALTEQMNQRQMEDMQRRANPEANRPPPSYADVNHRPYAYDRVRRRSHSPQTGPGPFVQHQQDILQGPPAAGAGALNYSPNSNNRYGPPRQPPMIPTEGEYPSLVHECPTCGIQLPDVDSLQLHVADCLDRQDRHMNQS